MTNRALHGATSPAPEPESPWERWGWLMAVVWMIFLVYPIIGLVGSSAAPLWVTVGWTATATFATLYVVGFILGMRGGWRQPSHFVIVDFWLLLACALLTIPAIETQALSFLPFLMSYASYGLGRRWHWIVNILSIVAATATLLVTGRIGGHLQILAIIVLLAIVNTINTWLIDRSTKADQLKLALAASDERATVARDVHDLLGHSLTVVKLKAELASRLIETDPNRARAEIDDIVRISTEAISGIRTTVTGLRATDLTDQLTQCAAALQTAGVRVDLVGSTDALSPAQTLPAGWILREATTNILRHARATGVRITVAPGTLLVEDDGEGVTGQPGNGFKGMSERATAAGADLQIAPRPDGGTRVSVIW